MKKFLNFKNVEISRTVNSLLDRYIDKTRDILAKEWKGNENYV